MEITEIVDATQRHLEPDLPSILHEEIERLPKRPSDCPWSCPPWRA